MFWSVRGLHLGETIWKRGVGEFNAKRISRIKSHPRDGGELWIGTDAADMRHTEVVQQSELEHQRIRRIGCVLAIKATGKGDVDIIRKLNQYKQIFLSRDGAPRDGGFLTVKQYRFVRKVNEVAVAEPNDAPGVFQQSVEAIEGSTWLGIIMLYFAKVPGPLDVKVPMAFFLLSVMGRAAGNGALVPIAMAIRASRIALRSAVDFFTGSGGSTDGWYWAFLFSLTWPAFTLLKYAWRRVIGKNENSPTINELGGEQWEVHRLHRRKDRTIRHGQHRTQHPVVRATRTIKPDHAVRMDSFCRKNPIGRRQLESVETIRRNGVEWQRKKKYGEWIQAHQCTEYGCKNAQSGTVCNGLPSTLCLQHLVVVGLDGPTSNRLPAMDDGRCITPNQVGGESRNVKYEGNALGRVMKLQKRAMRGNQTPQPQYPIGHNLSVVERKAGYAHKPTAKNGKPLCYNHSSHDGCNKGDACMFSHVQRIRPEGLRWAARYDLARRGGLLTRKRIESGAVEGYLQALRRQNTIEVKKTVEESKNTGRKTKVWHGWENYTPGLMGRVEKNAADCMFWKKGFSEKSIVQPKQVLGNTPLVDRSQGKEVRKSATSSTTLGGHDTVNGETTGHRRPQAHRGGNRVRITLREARSSRAGSAEGSGGRWRSLSKYGTRKER